MSSYGKQKAFAAIILTLAVIIALRIAAEILFPAPPPYIEHNLESKTRLTNPDPKKI